MSFLFGKPPPDPKEQVKEWRSRLRREMRQLDRQIMKIEREEMQVKQSMKQAAKKGQMDVARVLAKSMVQSRKAKTRIHCSKAQINSVIMQMQNQLSMMKVAGAMQKSADVMNLMSDLVKLPEIRETMMNLGREMEKAGLIEEMMDDTLNMDDEEVEEAADEEVDKVLFEITAGVLDQGKVGTSEPERRKEAESVANTDADDDELLARLAALK